MQSTPAHGPTLGVEEELHVVDAKTGRLLSQAPDVLAGLTSGSTSGGHGGESVTAEVVDPVARIYAAGHVVQELTLSQVETVTGVSTSVQQVIERAGQLRAAVAQAARRRGLGLLASGTPVLGDVEEQVVSNDERYLALRTRAAGLIDQQLIAGMHVHVGFGSVDQGVAEADDDLRAAVVDGLRPWLPALLALSANSPYWLGTDTGFASYRQVHWQRWPVAGPPPMVRDAVGWRRAVSHVVDAGVVQDASFVYWDVRLATRFPTVEVRVADVLATLSETATFVALVRGLAARTAADHYDNRSALEVPLHALRAQMWRAARYGLEDQLPDPASGGLVPAAQALHGLLEHARPGLERTGDLDLAVEGIQRVLQDGNGATRQRRAFARAGWPAVLEVVQVGVEPDTAPTPTVGDGNGWVRCQCGQEHWGRYGAAGLLVTRPGAEGLEVLLQLRATWTHQGGTWGLPGGARDSHESAAQAARREAHEETAIEAVCLVDVSEVVDDHGNWSYTYVVVHAPDGVHASAANSESDAVAWVPVTEVGSRLLHPALGRAWPMLRQRLGSR